MAHRLAKAELTDAKKKGPLPPAPRRGSGHPMLAMGQPHVLHRVGDMLGGSGARASACRIVGAFYEPPPGPKYPQCPDCYETSS